MGERKGQNHYYPPDFNYKVHKNLNAYHGTHALRERAKKIGEGILTIRFEMPFNVWCLGCNNHVGMGVRYNAEKKKIGFYYTTPLFEFRMKCHLCDNYFTIRTDPKNFDYELVEGLRRQEKRFDSGQLDNLAPVDRGLNQRLTADAMYKSEHDVEDKKKLESTETQLHRLESIQSRMYDDVAANAYLRRTFRGEKKALNERRVADEGLKQRLSLQNIKLLPESEDDRKVAKHLSNYGLGSFSGNGKTQLAREEEILNRPLFAPSGAHSSRSKESKNGKAALLEAARKRSAAGTLSRHDGAVALAKRQRELGVVQRKKTAGIFKDGRTGVESDT